MKNETQEVETQPIVTSDEQKGDAMSATATVNAPEKKEKAAPKAAKEAKETPKTALGHKFLGTLVAQQRAAREGTSVEVGFEYVVPLRRIVGSDNPRRVPGELVRLGYKLVDPNDHEHSLIHMATSSNMEVVRQCVTLFEEHEGDLDGHLDDDRDVPVGEQTPKSIVSLAHQFRTHGQLQAIVVRPVGSGDNRTLIFGQRRTAAAVYLHAKSRVEVADGEEGAKIYPATIRAVERKVTNEEAYDMAVAENFHRKNFDTLEEAAVYEHHLESINPETGKKYTLREVARKHGVHVGRVRSYAALLKPRNERTGKGLTDEDRRAVDDKTMTVTGAVRRALGEQHYSDGSRQEHRAKPIPLKEMQKRFDNTAESRTERREAIAECMGLTLEKAIKDSDKRINEAEERENRRRHREASGTPSTDSVEQSDGDSQDEE